MELGWVSLKLAKKGGKGSVSLGAESGRKSSAALRVVLDDTGSVCCLFCSSASRAAKPSKQSSGYRCGHDTEI